MSSNNVSIIKQNEEQTYWVDMLGMWVKEAEAKLKWVKEWVREDQWSQGDKEYTPVLPKPFHLVAHIKN